MPWEGPGRRCRSAVVRARPVVTDVAPVVADVPLVLADVAAVPANVAPVTADFAAVLPDVLAIASQVLAIVSQVLAVVLPIRPACGLRPGVLRIVLGVGRRTEAEPGRQQQSHESRVHPCHRGHLHARSFDRARAWEV